MKSEFKEALSALNIAHERNKLRINDARLLLLLSQAAEKASLLLPFERCQFDVSFFDHTSLWRLTTCCSLPIQKVVERRSVLRNSIIDRAIRTGYTAALCHSFRLEEQAALRSIKSHRLLLLTVGADLIECISLVTHEFKLGASLDDLAQSLKVMV